MWRRYVANDCQMRGQSFVAAIILEVSAAIVVWRVDLESFLCRGIGRHHHHYHPLLRSRSSFSVFIALEFNQVFFNRGGRTVNQIREYYDVEGRGRG